MQSLADFLGVPDPARPGRLAAPEPENLTAESFCRNIIASPEYRQSILNRIILGGLPPAVECLMWHYAYGKAPDRVEHTGKDGAPIITEVRRIVVHVNAEQSDESVATSVH